MYKKLPHISNYGYYQFVTFRTEDSIDEYLTKMINTTIENSKKQYKIDRYLDNSINGRYLNNTILNISKEYIIQQDKKLFDLVCFSIMPNHIHILFKETIKLNEAIRKLKGGLSFIINKSLNKKGRFWAKDYYDKSIRDKKHFDIVYRYIKNNAIKVNLGDSKIRFYSVYELDEAKAIASEEKCIGCEALASLLYPKSSN